MVFTGRITRKASLKLKLAKLNFLVKKAFHRAKVKKGVLLVVTYRPLLKSIGKIIYDNLYLLYINKELKHRLHQVLWSISDVLGRYEVTWLELSCIQLKGRWGLLVVKDHVARFVHMLMRRS